MSRKLASRFRSLVSELIPPNEMLLCLQCCKPGHAVRDCPLRYEYSELECTQMREDWLYSEERISTMSLLLSHVGDELCNRCRSLKSSILQMMNADAPFIGNNFTRQNYRKLGPIDRVRLRRDCPLCICLFDMLCRSHGYWDGAPLHLFAVRTATHISRRPFRL